MSNIQKIIKIIANAAKSVGDKPFEAALLGLNDSLDEVPEELHLEMLEEMWGAE